MLYVADAIGTATGSETDFPDQTTANYTYDEIGQLTGDNEDDLKTVYDASGLVTEIRVKSTNVLKLGFLYNDKGLRQKKTVYNSGGTATDYYWYVYDGGGTLQSTYHTVVSTSTTTQDELYMYAGGRLGTYRKTNSKYLYELTDHLGNVRAVVSRNSGSGLAEVLSFTDYYPHGGVLPSRNYVSSPAYTFNGVQGNIKDAETSLTNFDLRQMDPRLGRWFAPDPMGQYHSPYLAMGNNPVNMIDPYGGWTIENGDQAGGGAPWHDYMSMDYGNAADAWQNYHNYDPGMSGEALQNYFDSKENRSINIHNNLSAGNHYNSYRGEWGHWKSGDQPKGGNKAVSKWAKSAIQQVGLKTGSIINLGQYGKIRINDYSGYPDKEMTGLHVNMTYEPNKNNPNIGYVNWVQTFNTNSQQGGNGVNLNEPIGNYFMVDPIVIGNKPHFFYDEDYNTPEKNPMGKRTFDDPPGRFIDDRTKVVYMKFELSLIIKTPEGYKSLVTFEYGLYQYTSGWGKVNSLKVKNIPSTFHKNVINGLNSTP